MKSTPDQRPSVLDLHGTALEREIEELTVNRGHLELYPTPRMTKYGEQDENGVDWSLIRANLRLTPDQRCDKHFRALVSVLEAKDAVVPTE
ncbi:MAG: hypothetical protein AAF743_04845 [Planctomycetota bacterium]